MEAEENTQLSLRWKVKRSSEKFASEEYIVVFFAAESSEEQASERSLFKVARSIYMRVGYVFDLRFSE